MQVACVTFVSRSQMKPEQEWSPNSNTCDTFTPVLQFLYLSQFFYLSCTLLVHVLAFFVLWYVSYRRFYPTMQWICTWVCLMVMYHQSGVGYFIYETTVGYFCRSESQTH